MMGQAAMPDMLKYAIANSVNSDANNVDSEKGVPYIYL